MPVRRLAILAPMVLIGAPLAAQQAAQDLGPSQPVATSPTGAIMRGDAVILPVKSRLVFVTSEEISSRRARKGDLIKLALRDDLLFEGDVLVPAGTSALGEITFAQKKGFMGEGGKLSARTLYFDLPSGPVRITGPLVQAGEDQTELATLVATASLGMFMFVTGKSAVIPKGTQLTAVLDREARIPVPEREPDAPAAAP
ncbi:hypothetical protein [Erythrobacter sp. JK5]|uniref:hypothetical protein n=1 Tax=Erythrobacter sp. JK5 TaxID=2829500 RepID=UPI001BAA3D0C|nr:hypothetical protein [Erythrobacter sp. JK5]QUL37737.1 hypothetical protein KDC96_15590 [Erythrobacter sp. JK5]